MPDILRFGEEPTGAEENFPETFLRLPFICLAFFPMTTNRIVAGALSVLLLALLGWSLLAGVGDLHTHILLAVGACLGGTYTYLGSLPQWIVNHSGQTITDDDDPSNISPRIYLPILIGVILVAVLSLVVVLNFL